MRAVVDTNIWVSAAIAPAGFCAIVLDRLRRHEFTAIVSPEMMQELSVVLNRPQLARKYQLPGSSIAGMIMLIRDRAEEVVIAEWVPISRDPRDDIFIATALSAEADYLVTRDDDLKRDANVLQYFGGSRTAVVSVRDFLETLDRPA